MRSVTKSIRIHSIKPYRLFNVANFCIGPAKPNPKSLVILKSLPITITNTELSQLVSGIDTIRRSEVEPGCALHLIDEVKAEIAAKQIRSLNLKANIQTTCLPSLVLHNIPNNITHENISKAFEQYNPTAIRFSGKRQIIVSLINYNVIFIYL